MDRSIVLYYCLYIQKFRKAMNNNNNNINNNEFNQPRP